MIVQMTNRKIVSKVILTPVMSMSHRKMRQKKILKSQKIQVPDMVRLARDVYQKMVIDYRSPFLTFWKMVSNGN